MNILSSLVNSINKHLGTFYTQMHSASPATPCDPIEVEVQETPDPLTETLVLRASVSEEHRQVHISNIFIPVKFRRQGIGFGLIKEILKVADAYEYELFIVDMTNSFYNCLLERNAQPAGYDAVKVDATTRL